MDTWEYNVAKKRKIKKEEDYDEEPMFSDMMPTGMGGIFGSSHDIRREGNDIYFYASVNKNNMLELTMLLKAVEKDNLRIAFNNNIEVPKIYLHINSYGGSIFAAFAFIDAIKKCTVPVVSIIEGCAASAATMISIVCDERQITEHSYMLIHELSSGVWGKYSEIEEEFNNLKKMMKMIKDLYKKHTKIKMSELDKCLKKDVWWTAKECLQYGLVDKIN